MRKWIGALVLSAGIALGSGPEFADASTAGCETAEPGCVRAPPASVCSVKIAGRQARGTIEARGRQRRFRATRTRKRDAGLHFAIGKQPNRLLLGGWILHPDGTQ